MKNTMHILIGLLLASGVAFAGEVEDGNAAYGRGDYATAFTKLKKAAEQGDAVGQASLGWMYKLGRGVLKDYQQAVYWWTKAAEQGYVEGQVELGGMYERGSGVPKDYVRAYMWLNLAAAQSNEYARHARDVLEHEMTSEQIAEAQRLSREWKPR